MTLVAERVDVAATLGAGPALRAWLATRGVPATMRVQLHRPRAPGSLGARCTTRDAARSTSSAAFSPKATGSSMRATISTQRSQRAT